MKNISEEDRIKLKIAEIVGNIEIEGKTAYMGFEASGNFHAGHLIPLNVLRYLSDNGANTILWIADWHTILNSKEVENYDSIVRQSPPNCRVLIQSEVLKTRSIEWLNSLSELSRKVNLKRCIRSIECSGRNDEDVIKMSSLIYALMQAVDMHCLDVDIAIGGTDQRKVNMLAVDTFKKLGWKVPVMIHTEILKGKDGLKMSKSNPENCDFI